MLHVYSFLGNEDGGLGLHHRVNWYKIIHNSMSFLSAPTGHGMFGYFGFVFDILGRLLMLEGVILLIEGVRQAGK